MIGGFTRELIERALAERAAMRPIAQDWERFKGTPKQWDVIRRAYAHITPQIMEGRRRCPYILDWQMTPIEQDVWQSIRSLGLPFFPQYPVDRYFIDFADPVRQIGLECDGKQWHDAEKDAKRDARLHKLGWQIIRFTGRRCYMGEENPESAHEELKELQAMYRGAQ